MAEDTVAAAEAVEETKPVEMSREEYDQKLRDVTLGKTDVMPDGTPLKEVHANIKKMEAEQDEQRKKHVKKSFKTTVPQPEDTGKVRVTTSPTGVSAVETVMTEVKPPVPTNDLPDDLPGRGDILKNGHVNWELVKKMSHDDFVKMKGIGEAKADAIIGYIEAE